jgi:hypothetical protein
VEKQRFRNLIISLTDFIDHSLFEQLEQQPFSRQRACSTHYRTSRMASQNYRTMN